MALLKLLLKLAGTRSVNCIPFPEHIWMRHSALLVAARNNPKRHGKV